jgi:hypothetical protein
MILSFMENFPRQVKYDSATGEKVPTKFIDQIQAGQKIHTIRATKQNWRVGMKIQVYTGRYTKGGRVKHFDMVCKGTQTIEIDFTNKLAKSVKVDGRELSLVEMFSLAQNDGFSNNSSVDWASFQKWFGNEKPFKGIIIHWTNKRY